MGYICSFVRSFVRLFVSAVGVWMGVYFIFIFISVKLEIGKMIHIYCWVAAVTRAWPHIKIEMI